MLNFDLLMAIAIAAIIGLMAAIKNSKVKAIIYGIPIPITIAFLTTNKIVNSTHIIGLILLTFFIWLTYFFHNKKNIHILASDFISALTYILISFPLLRFFSNVNFSLISIIYFSLWFTYMNFFYKTKNPIKTESKISPLVKVIVVLPIAYSLFKLSSLLKGVIVTFPFSGVFAVIESQNNLYTLATEFTKNSIAILILLIMLKVLLPYFGLISSLLISWIIYFIVFTTIQKSADKIFS